MSEKERLKIKTRQAEGIAAAKAKGKRFGRPAAAVPANFDGEIAKWRGGEQTATQTMRALGLKKTTFYKLANGL